MKHISILILKDAIVGSIDASKQMFSKVNELLAETGQPPVFNVNTVGIIKKTRVNDLMTIHCDQVLSEVIKTDMIIIPMICNGFPQAIAANKDFTNWIINQYNDRAEIASLCVGAFFLASTGLLDGKTCAVHWGAANEFSSMFPKVKLVNNKLITYGQGIYTSGGYYSYLNLLINLIEKYAGREMSILMSKMFEIERKSQAPFMIFKGQKNHCDEPVKIAQEFIENNYQDKITIDQLTAMLSVGRRNFERRFKKATANTIVEYMQRVKIEAVKKGLEISRKSIIELMYEVGYADIKAFRTTFRKFTGLSPVEYRNKYCFKVLLDEKSYA